MKRQVCNLIVFILLMSVLSLMLTSCESSQQITVPQDMVGEWVGLGQHSLGQEFLNQREIPFQLSITEKGNIHGYIGDASIKKTVLQKTPIWLRVFGKEKYRAVVQLGGNIVNTESFKRDGGTLYFYSFATDDIVMGFTSTGSQVDAQNMVLPVKEIRLRHPQ